MTDRTHRVPGTGAAFSRRRMLALCASAVALPSVLGACTASTGVGGSDTDAILALADRARSDAGLLSAAVTNDPRLATAFDPLRAARLEHAAALDAMGRRTTPPATLPTGDTSTVDGNTVKDAIIRSAKATANAVTGATPDQAGVLAGVFACCATYSDPRASLESVQVPTRSSDDDTSDSATRVAVDSLQRALAGEHAAIWAYTLALAFVPPDWAARARDDIEAHKELRTTLTEALTAQGEKPVSAQPAYAPPQPVLDAVSAGALLVTAEADTTAALRSMIERASTSKLRVLGLSWMTGSTGRSAFWRGATDRAPAIPVFPGRE